MGLLAGARSNGLDQIATLVCAGEGGEERRGKEREGKKSISCLNLYHTNFFFFHPSALCDRSCGHGFCANTGLDKNECICNQNYYTLNAATPCANCMTHPTLPLVLPLCLSLSPFFPLPLVLPLSLSPSLFHLLSSLIFINTDNCSKCKTDNGVCVPVDFGSDHPSGCQCKEHYVNSRTGGQCNKRLCDCNVRLLCFISSTLSL